jgi:hypothetical protein
MPIEVTATGAPENLVLALAPAFEVEGRVEVVQSTTSLARISVRLVAGEGLAPGPPPVSKVAADGSIRLTGVTPGIWDLALDPLPEGLWLKSATYGQVDVVQGQLNIAPGPPGVLHIVLAGNGGQISGAVTAGGEPSHATVVLAPAANELRRAPSLYRTTATQDHGLFVFKNVHPGTYKLFAFEDVEPFTWLDADVMKPVESLGETVSVEEGQQVQRQLIVIPAEALLPAH